MWKDIEGYEGNYQVSEEGEVKSLGRVVSMKNGRTKTVPERIRALTKDRHGYYFVSLSKNSKIKHKRVHRLVAKAFLENPNGLPQVNHIDSDKLNNNVENLEWCDGSHNSLHAQKNISRELPGTPKLTIEEVANVVMMLNSDKRVCDIARRFKVDRRTIRAIRNGEAWVRVPRGIKTLEDINKFVDKSDGKNRLGK